MVRLLRCLAVLGICLAPGALARAAGPEGAAPKPSAAELVAGIIANESQIDSVRSLYLRFEGKVTRPPESIARTLAELQKLQPGKEIDIATNSNLWPELTEELELAFDGKRVRKLFVRHKERYNLKVFDGERAIQHLRNLTGDAESYGLDPSPQPFFDDFFLNLPCPRMGPHRFWFLNEKASRFQQGERSWPLPSDFALVDETELRGRRCYVLENRVAPQRLHVGVDDRRLHGTTMLMLPSTADTLPTMNRAAARTFASQDELGAWLRGLTEEERSEFRKRLTAEQVGQVAFMRPRRDELLDDYRELAPGFWFPATQGYTIFDLSSEKPQVKGVTRLHLVEAKVNEPLADSLFTIELKDGVQVYDRTHDPPLAYKQKADRTPDEWQQMIDERKQQDDEWRKQNAARDALVGQPAPELPESVWVNSKPLALASLKGKAVVLDFWAASCGPCRNDFPLAKSAHGNTKESGIVVIGVHAADAEAGEVEKFAKEMKLSYPIVIDLPPPGGTESFGQLLFTQLGVRGIPYAFVIDQEGKIAGHGELRQVLGMARTLAGKSTK